MLHALPVWRPSSLPTPPPSTSTRILKYLHNSTPGMSVATPGFLIPFVFLRVLVVQGLGFPDQCHQCESVVRPKSIYVTSLFICYQDFYSLEWVILDFHRVGRKGVQSCDSPCARARPTPVNTVKSGARLERSCIMRDLLRNLRAFVNREITLHPRWYLLLQIMFFIWGVIWIIRPPAPDEAMLLLGLVAAIVTIQGQMSDNHRVAWFVIMLVMFGAAW